jgi:hypothetical protein
MSRRVSFFLIASVTCGLLTFVAPGELRLVPVVVAGVYAVLASLTALEEWSEARRDREPRG